MSKYLFEAIGFKFSTQKSTDWEKGLKLSPLLIKYNLKQYNLNQKEMWQFSISNGQYFQSLTPFPFWGYPAQWNPPCGANYSFEIEISNGNANN